MPSRKDVKKATAAARKGQRKTNLKSPIYHDEDAARAHIESMLWPHGPMCPRVCCSIGAKPRVSVCGSARRSLT